MRSPPRRAARTAAPHAARTARQPCAPRACGLSQRLRLSGSALTLSAPRLFRAQKQFTSSAGLSGIVGYASAILVKVLAGGALTVLAATFALLKVRSPRIAVREAPRAPPAPLSSTQRAEAHPTRAQEP